MRVIDLVVSVVHELYGIIVSLYERLYGVPFLNLDTILSAAHFWLGVFTVMLAYFIMFQLAA